MGPPPELVESIRDSFGVRVFVETGTFRGRTANWASTLFPKVITIEASEEIWKQARTKYSSVTNIEFRHGRSEEVLNKVVRAIRQPAVFWLDAHWSGGNTFGSTSICPIRREIKEILVASCQHVVLVDDVRLFLAPPPLPHDPDNWPSIGELLSDLQAVRPEGYQAITVDILISVPPHARLKMSIEYCQDAQTEEEARRRWERRLSNITIGHIMNIARKRV